MPGLSAADTDVQGAVPPLPERLAFVDLETTGATGTHDRITEVGIVRVGPQGSDEWSTLLNPGVPISPFIEQLTGISNAMVARAPAFADVAAALRERLAGHVFIAHNARFDYGFLRAEFRRLDHVFRAPVVCTVKLSRKLYPQHHKHNLDALISRHGLRVGERHRALGDARLIHQFWTLHQGAEATRLASTVHEMLAASCLPAHLDAGLRDDMPDGRGVCVFFDADGAVLYIGRSKTLRAHVLGHFHNARAQSAKSLLAARVRRIACYPVADEGEALLLEARLRREPAFIPAPGRHPG